MIAHPTTEQIYMNLNIDNSKIINVTGISKHVSLAEIDVSVATSVTVSLKAGSESVLNPAYITAKLEAYTTTTTITHTTTSTSTLTTTKPTTIFQKTTTTTSSSIIITETVTQPVTSTAWTTTTTVKSETETATSEKTATVISPTGSEPTIDSRIIIISGIIPIIMVTIYLLFKRRNMAKLKSMT